MDDLKKQVLSGFDVLTQKLYDFDDRTKGGLSLLLSDQFNSAAMSSLSSAERDKIVGVSQAIHDFVKAASTEVWWAWFTSSREGMSDRQALEKMLTDARNIVERRTVRSATHATIQDAHFFDRGARFVDDLGCSPS